MMNYPKVLVISNQSFSKSEANGRTLGNFFEEWPKENLSQFYIKKGTPNFDLCNQYFMVTDKEAIDSIIKFKRVGKIVTKESENSNLKSNESIKKSKKNPLSAILRNIVWEFGFWKKGAFKQWIDDISPEVIVVQAGDTAFMLKLATTLSVERKIPLIVYNSEDYFFKNYNYFPSKKYSLLYPVFLYDFQKKYTKLMDRATHTIYNTEKLQEIYSNKFKHNSSVLMTSTNLETTKNTLNITGEFKISYLGNLSLKRHESLIEFANALNSINQNWKLEVYGKVPNQVIEQDLNSCKGINFKGLVSYDEVKKIIQESNMLLHVESFDSFYIKDLKHGLSTKIADSLASGKPFIIYAPESLACTQYLKKTSSACIITKKQELELVLRDYIQNIEEQKNNVENALNLSKENHDVKKNADKFQKIIVDSGKKEGKVNC